MNLLDKNYEKALKLISELISWKTDDIIQIFTHSEKESIEKDTKF